MPGQLKGTIPGKDTSLNGLFKDDSGPDLKIIGKFDTIPPKDIRKIPEGFFEFTCKVESTKVYAYYYKPGHLGEGVNAATTNPMDRGRPGRHTCQGTNIDIHHYHGADRQISNIKTRNMYPTTVRNIRHTKNNNGHESAYYKPKE
ncbi:hypothetical protein CPC08DRAFT_726404 [Agrocybe pediades]|nr:hypothetical protein CPC08DRAFT_726404 [Agrocybe pediades]